MSTEDNRHSQVWLVSVFLGFFSLFIAIAQIAFPSWSFKSPFVLGVILSLFVALLAWLVIRTLDRNSTLVTMSVLGFPGTGKTVYLTALFDELQQAKQGGIQFTPYGLETVEQVMENLTTLSKGKWLPRTRIGDVFFYRANASMGGAFFKKRFKIEIADYAGENIGELDPTDKRWLHKTSYFKDIILSDAIILAIDTEILINGPSERIEEMQNSFVAAFQILAQEKGALDGRKLKAPVALLFLKADLADEKVPEFENVLPRRISRLLHVCKAGSRHFKFFFVSSVGYVEPDGSPPSKLRPWRVVEPLIWLLKHSNRT